MWEFFALFFLSFAVSDCSKKQKDTLFLLVLDFLLLQQKAFDIVASDSDGVVDSGNRRSGAKRQRRRYSTGRSDPLLGLRSR